ncbi:MAG: glycoside hydrolase family 3 C-terminal domain-containing protein, partial [Myxococcota bacterium]
MTWFRSSVWAGCLVALAACSDGGQGSGVSEADALEAYCPIDSAEVESRIDELLETLTLQEKASLMHGTLIVPVNGTWESTAIPDKGIPGFHMLDGPKGVGGPSQVMIANGALTTTFPVPIARSATWSPALERQVGAAIAQEARAVGADVLLAPGMNLSWHPLSGRNQEYYGEDPFLAGEIGVGFVRGVQSMGVVATAKHYTANHIEDTRLDINVIVDERTLRESFLPQFRKVVVEGAVGSVMSAYNQVNGSYCGDNAPLLGDILKGDWGFAGYVVADFIWGAYNTVPSAIAGLDLEMPRSEVYGAPVVDAVTRGELEESNVDDHVRRMLRAQFCYQLDTDPAEPDDSLLETSETIALAREVAAKAITLLRNENDILPLSTTAAQEIVLVGPLADRENIGDLRGSSGVRSSEVITIAEGLLARDDVAATITVVEGDLSDPDSQATVTDADIVLIAVGLTDEEEGEGQVRPPAVELGAGDREIYGIPAEHAALLANVRALNDQIIVVLEGGSAIDVTPWFEDTEAVVMAWYPGVQGGTAIADVLFGDANPQGRLPVSFPSSLGDLQAFP